MNTERSIIVRFLLLGVWQLFNINFSNGQDTIYLKNPSFEDQPRIGSAFSKPITDWNDCGLENFPDESPPDIFSARIRGWGVKIKPYDGKSYLSLVTRYSDTYESISQLLDKPIEAGKCYRITAYLALSEIYESGTERSPLIEFKDGNISGTRKANENFSNPVELFIWGGDNYCRKRKLLASSGAVSNNDWTLFTFEFTSKEIYTYITIGAFFKHGYTEPYNGHVLVDNLSPIIEIECK